MPEAFDHVDTRRQPLERTHTALAAALEPLGIECGPDVLAVWLDRHRNGREALPEPALRELFYIVADLLAERVAAGKPRG